MTNIPDLGPVEHQLLRLLWKRSPSTAKEVQAEYNQRNSTSVKYTTVMTLLTRMVEKGALQVDRSRQPFHFSPRVSRDQILRHRVHDFVDLFFDGRPADLALRLVEDADLSPEALDKLEALLKQHREQKGGSSE